MIIERERQTQDCVRLVLGVARLGEADLRGWWRSHCLSQTGEYVLSSLLPRTWRPAALELDIASAARLHNQLLDRSSALHLFSDQLPFRRWAAAWLSEQKTAAPSPLIGSLQTWDEPTALATLEQWTARADLSTAELLGSGLLVGTVTREELQETDVLKSLAHLLAAAYLDQGCELRPPYVDLLS